MRISRDDEVDASLLKLRGIVECVFNVSTTVNAVFIRSSSREKETETRQ
jgi:hypothetical protein